MTRAIDSAGRPARVVVRTVRITAASPAEARRLADGLGAALHRALAAGIGAPLASAPPAAPRTGRAEGERRESPAGPRMPADRAAAEIVEAIRARVEAVR